jgi:hypothetical protein
MTKNKNTTNITKKNIENVYKKLGLSNEENVKKIKELSRNVEEDQKTKDTWIISDSSSTFPSYK